MKPSLRFFFLPLLALVVPLLWPNSAAARYLGVDVSSYQGTGVNWPTAKGGGIVFAWAKATEGGGVNDADYTYNMSNGKSAGVIMGSYHYAHSELNTAATEASHFWGRAATYTKSDGLTLMPMLDMESSALTGYVGSTSVSDWVNDWCTDIVQYGAATGAGSLALTPIIYVSACNAHYFDSTVGQWGADIANYSGNDPQTSTPWTACSSGNVWGGWDFWQYDSTGGITGYSGNIDKDVFNGTTGISAWTVGSNTNSPLFWWDPQGTTGSNPYTGNMSTNWETAKWSYTSAGLSTPVNWVNGKAAVFGVHTGTGTPAFTLTMNSSHTVAGFFDGALSGANSCDVTITGAGTVNLASGPQGFDSVVSSDGSVGRLRLYCNMAGSGQLFPEGNAYLYLHGSNTFSGGTTIGFSNNSFSGTLYFNNANAFGTGVIEFWSHGTGATVSLEGSSAVTVPNNVKVSTATTNNIIGNSAGLTFSGNWDLSGGLFTLGGGGTAGNKTIIAGVASGNKGLTVYNSGTIVLTGVNTYTGTTTINSPAVLQLDGTGVLGSGSYANSLVNNGTFIDSSTASQTMSGVISGSGTVRVADAGVLVLTAANTYSGTTVVSNGGTLCITADSSLGTNTLTLNGGCLKNNNSAPTLASTRTISLGTSGAYFDAGWGPANNITLNAKLTGSGSLNIDLDGSAVVLNNTANNYTGNTIVGANGPGYYSGGTQALLKMGTSNVVPKGSGNGSVTINRAWQGVLDMNGTTQGFNGLSGDGTISNSTGFAALTIGNNNASSTFNGNIINNGSSFSLTKTGTGTITLNGTNTYNGNTTISAGTLALGSTGSISNSPLVVIVAGATLDVSANSYWALSSSSTLNCNGTTSAATLKGGTTVDLGSRPITINYDGSHVGLTVSQGTLALNGNTITVNGSVLADGIYPLIQQTTGNISASGTLTATGSALGGKPASISISGGTVSLVLNQAPNITTQPQSQTSGQGANVTFNVAATGTTPLGYQWRLNGANISGATSTTYTRTSVTLNDSGSYSVVVTNPVTSVTSSDAVLTISTCTATLQSINALATTSVSMTFNVGIGYNYSLSYKDTLQDAQWNLLSTSSPGGSTLSVSDASALGTQRFYQVSSSCVASLPCGFIALPLLGNSDNYVSLPFSRPAAALGNVVSVSGNVLTVQTINNVSWTPNQFVYASGSQPNNYYARFSSGALAGQIFSITANDTNSLTLNLNGGSLSGVVANDLVYVEPYWTLGTVFPGGAGVNVSPSIGNRNTEVLVPDLTGSGINLSAAKIYFFNNGVWKLFGPNTDHTDDTLQPNAYFIVRHNVATNTTLVTAGSVVDSALSIALNVPQNATDKQDNYIGLMRPSPVSLNDSQLISSGAFVASPLPGNRTDELLIFDNSAGAKNKSSAGDYYYWNSAWRRVGFGTNDVGTDQIFTPGTGVILRKGTNVPATWVNSPNY